MTITGGFGTTMDLERGTSRQWVMGRDGVKRWADTNDPVEARPLCAVRGMVRPGAMCGEVIVGGEFCGHAGECPHKLTPNASLEGRAAFGASARSDCCASNGNYEERTDK